MKYEDLQKTATKICENKKCETWIDDKMIYMYNKKTHEIHGIEKAVFIDTITKGIVKNITQ